MIPKVRVPEIDNFMNGYLVNDYTSNSSTMDVYVPQIMIDKSLSNVVNNVGINNSIFVSAENIRTSSVVTSRSYITVAVSPIIQTLFQLTTSGIKHYSKGSLVRLYVPNLNLDNAIVMPL